MDRVGRLLGLTPGNVFGPYVKASLSVAAVVLMAMAAALGLGLAPLYVWSVGLSAAAVAVFFGGVFVYAARREAAERDALLGGEIWARWHYAAADNERLAREEWERTQTMVRQSAGSAALAGSIVAGTLAVSGLGLVLSAALSGGIAAVLLLIAAILFLRGRARFRLRVGQTRELVFGPAVLMREGATVALRGRKVRLQSFEFVPATAGSVGTEPTPAMLRVVRQVERTATSFNDWDIFPRRYWATSELSIPVPSGQDAAAPELVDRYRRLYALAPNARTNAQSLSERAAGLAPRPS
jgi:hypothetical protein